MCSSVFYVVGSNFCEYWQNYIFMMNQQGHSRPAHTQLHIWFCGDNSFQIQANMWNCLGTEIEICIEL